MLEIKSKLKIARAAYKVEVKGRLRLPFAQRQQRGAKAKLESGEEATLMLPRGEVLRGGDLVTASDGRVIEVEAEAEKLIEARFAGAEEMARAAYRLGDRHVPVEFRADSLRVADDHGVEEMLKTMGARLGTVQAPFEPVVEPPHAHGHDEHRHDHDHHDHGHDHHGHGHGHKH